MPRRTTHDYSSARSSLSQLWEQRDGYALAVLPGHAQRDLHDYFPFRVPMTDQEALAHRTAMTRAFPSLPQSAGRAFQAVNAHLEGQPNQMVDRHLERVTVSNVKGAKSNTIRVLGVARPKIDLDLFTRAVTRFIQNDMNSQSTKPPRKRPPRK